MHFQPVRFYGRNSRMSRDERNDTYRNSQTTMALIEAYFEANPTASVTCEQLAKLIGKTKYNVRSRVTELKKSGYLKEVSSDKGEEGKTVQVITKV
jgi:predicted HTH transcriptional regulator